MLVRLPKQMSEPITYKEHMAGTKIEAIFQKEAKRLLGFIRKQVSEMEDAEDLLQDVFYQLTANYEKVTSIDKVSSWLFTVARNKITDLYRKKKAEPFSKHRPKNDDEDGDYALGLEAILPDKEGLADDAMMRSLIWEQVQEGLGELPEEQREVFVMHEFEDKSFKEIAALTGETVNTLLSRKRYAVLYLRERLRELYNLIKS